MKPITRRLYAIAVIVLAAVIFVALNIAVDATFTTAKIDLTETGLYTLSGGTKNIIAKLREPVTLKFYYSKKIATDYAQISTYANRVRDLLSDYAARSHGKIILEEIDPEPFTEAEDEATSAGLSGAPTDTGESVYFGLVGTNTIDGRETIAFFSPEREPFLEYDITSLIYRLSQPKKPQLAIVSSLPLDTGAGGMAAMLQGQAQPYMTYQELASTYSTRMLDQNFDSIPKDVDVLMIVHPGPLNDLQVYAIDQFVMKGGHVLAFVDPYAEIANPGGGFDQQGAAPPSSGLPRLFQSWGITYNANKVLVDLELAQQVQTANGVASYPAWLHLGPDQFDKHDQITANLQALNLASTGVLYKARKAETTFTPLVWSSAKSALLDATQIRLNPRPQDLVNEVQPGGQRFVIAARISGEAKSAWPDGFPVAKTPGLKASKGPINVVVMADADIFDDRFWVRVDNVYGKKIASPFADNAAFVMNAVENLTGSSDLISLRTRATNNRPFTRVQELQASAQAQFQQEADALQQKLQDTQGRLRALEQGEGSAGKTQVTLTPKQQAEVERFKRELIETRTALRDVQHNLRKEVEALGSVLIFVNIWLVPILVAAFAIVLAVLRRRRRARAIPL